MIYITIFFFFFHDVTGRPDSMMLEKFLRHFKSINYTVVEPDQPAFHDFKQSVEKSSSLSQVVFDWRNMTIEEYWKTSEVRNFSTLASKVVNIGV